MIVISGDAALRSTLAARLTMRAIDVLTTASLGDPIVRRERAQPSILVLDADLLAEDASAAVAALVAEARWLRIVIVGDRGSAALAHAPAGSALQVTRSEAGEMLASLAEALSRDAG